MIWLLRHGNELFILFLAPVIGLILDIGLSRKNIRYVLCVSLFLLLPLLFGYQYTILFISQLLALASAGCLFSFLLARVAKQSHKYVVAILLSVLLFAALGFIAFMDSLSGTVKVEKSWWVKGYRIDYIADQGFAGGPLMKHEISKYAFIPVLIKKVDVSIGEDAKDRCVIRFEEVKIDFNKCSVTLSPFK